MFCFDSIRVFPRQMLTNLNRPSDLPLIIFYIPPTKIQFVQLPVRIYGNPILASVVS